MDGTGYERHDVLNEDIWFTVISFIDPTDAHSLSLVSRTTHRLARRLVLSRADISQQSQLTKACTFLLDDPRHRACWLRELHVHGSVLDDVKDRWCSAEGPSLAAKLEGALCAAQNLRTLALHGVESLLEAEPCIGTALISLKQLQVVRLSGILTNALDVANQMVSRPSDVFLHLAKPLGISEKVDEYLILLSHLALFSNARVVDIVFFDVHPQDRCEEPSDFDFELPQLGQHPTVREVGLRYGGPLPLFHIFPNMQVLRMRCMDTSFEQFYWDEWAWSESVPLFHVTADNDDQLECLEGACSPTLRQLHLHAPPSRVPEDDFSADSLRPVCLVFSIEEWEARRPWNVDRHPLWADRLAAIVNPGLGRRMRYLEITAQCQSRENMPAQWMEWLVPALRESALVCVRLNFDVWTPSGTVTKLDEVRHVLAENVPSLRYICISVGTTPRADLSWAYDVRVEGECTWWRVRGRVCGDSERISCEAGARVEEYLHSAEFERTLSLDGLQLGDEQGWRSLCPAPSTSSSKSAWYLTWH